MSARADALLCFEAALARVEPAAAVREALSVRAGAIHVGSVAYHRADFDRVLVLAAGKAAVPMAAEVEHQLTGFEVEGLVVTKRGHGGQLTRCALIESGHPVPDEASLQAGRAALALARSAGPRDLVLFLLSGGASSLLEALRAPLTLADLQTLTEALLRAGAPIKELNTVRKHVSTLKAGGLASAARHAGAQVSLLLSDVAGAGPEVIGSGPSLPDQSTWAEALAILERRLSPAQRTPALNALLNSARAGQEPDTRRADDPAFARARWQVIGDVELAMQTAISKAASIGYRASRLPGLLSGEASEAGRQLAQEATRLAAAHPSQPIALVTGGETTVTVRGTGRGGRDQELALAAALALEGHPSITLAALATDGGDGPTDAAGAIIDGTTCARMRAAGIDPQRALDNNDAYAALSHACCLIKTGPTRTNVNDLVIVLIANPCTNRVEKGGGSAQ